MWRKINKLVSFTKTRLRERGLPQFAEPVIYKRSHYCVLLVVLSKKLHTDKSKNVRSLRTDITDFGP